jgi:uncharacterized protein YaaN involved in tellurite resistance
MSSASKQLCQARTRTRISELEKANQTLQNQIELVNNKLSHRTSILAQTNAELSDLQTQYKEVLQKLVELSQRPTASDFSATEERLYRSQLKEQSICISALQGRLG